MDVPDARNQLVLLQQKRIRGLEAENRQLREDFEYTQKALYIALHDRYCGTPLVISSERLAEAKTEFFVDENGTGDHLIWVKGANT
jgi:hypothetical protein